MLLSVFTNTPLQAPSKVVMVPDEGSACITMRNNFSVLYRDGEIKEVPPLSHSVDGIAGASIDRPKKSRLALVFKGVFWSVGGRTAKHYAHSGWKGSMGIERV
jgi:hypothetical protein